MKFKESPNGKRSDLDMLSIRNEPESTDMMWRLCLKRNVGVDVEWIDNPGMWLRLTLDELKEIVAELERLNGSPI